jgi:hypothetical protein
MHRVVFWSINRTGRAGTRAFAVRATQMSVELVFFRFRVLQATRVQTARAQRVH